MPIDKRTTVGVIAAILLLSVIAGVVPVAAQSPPTTTTEPPETNTTTTTTPTTTATTASTPTTTASTTTTTVTTTAATEESPSDVIERVRSGPYSISELRKTGTVVANAEQKSLRALGEPPMGFMSMRYRDPTVFDAVMGNPGQWAEIANGKMVRQNDIQAYGSAFGPAASEYTLEIVYWQKDTVEVGNNSVPYAANQTIDTYTLDMSGNTLYTQQNISLRPHFDQTWQGTIFLKSGGEVEGRWTFVHRSNPSSAAVNIDSSGGAWAFAIRNAVIPGAVSVVAGLVLAWLTLKRIGRGPGYGVSTWVITVGLVSLIVSLVAYYQIAVILTNIPWVMGLSVGVIAFAAGLTFHDEAKRVGFLRRELVDADIIPGDRTRISDAIADGGTGAGVFGDDAGAEIFDELTEALYADLPDVEAVRTSEGYRVPVKGVRPAIARLFSDPALLDLTNIATRMKIKTGRLDDIILVEPESNPTLEHKPARLVRTLPIDVLPDEHTTGEEAIAWLMSAAIVLSPPTLGLYAMDAAMNLPFVGLFAGIAVTLVMAYSAEDGWIDFEVAPPHYKKAEDNLTMLQRAYKTAKEDQTGQQQAREERAKTAKEAREDAQEERTTVTDTMLSSLGVDASGSMDADAFEWEDEDGDEEGPDDE